MGKGDEPGKARAAIDTRMQEFASGKRDVAGELRIDAGDEERSQRRDGCEVNRERTHYEGGEGDYQQARPQGEL